MKTALLLAALTALFSATAAASQSPVSACSGGNYSSSSSYHQTLELLSSRLPLKVSTAARMFASDSVVTGEVTYALAQCRGDTDTAHCSTCIYEVLQDAEVACRLSKEVLIAYELCTLRLSGTAISWSPRVNMSVAQVDTVTVGSRTFEMGIDALIAGVASMAANTSQRFATAVEEIDTDDSHYTAYGLAQCIAELTPADCASCLKHLRSTNIITGWSGGWSSTTLCTYHFHLYKFFAREPMQQIPSVTPNTHRGDGKKKRRRLILGVVVVVSVALIVIILTLLAWVILRGKRRSSQKTKKTPSEQPRTESHISEEEEVRAPTVDRTACNEEEARAPTVDHTACNEEEARASTADHTACDALHSAIGFFNDIKDRAFGKRIILFLDYDGTLAAIVNNPLEAFMTEKMREAVQAAAQLFPTSIVTGREIPKAISFVNLQNLHYAGSHGMEIKISGQEEHYQPFPQLVPIVTEATKSLEKALQGIDGTFVENNKFCVSVHFRNVDEKDYKLVEDTVNGVLSDFSDLRLAPGKKVWELRSKKQFTKGDAVYYLVQHLLQHHLMMDSSRVLPSTLATIRPMRMLSRCSMNKATGLAFWSRQTWADPGAGRWGRGPPRNVGKFFYTTDFPAQLPVTELAQKQNLHRPSLSCPIATARSKLSERAYLLLARTEPKT
ncbi:unnamed protein product [Alopecurus aequalis]